MIIDKDKGIIDLHNEPFPITEKCLTTLIRDNKKIVVKPSRQGSSVGFSLIDSDNFEDRSKKTLEAIDYAFKYDNIALVEKFIEGREITVSILGKNALPVIEIEPKKGIYDYNAKYVKGASNYVCPAKLDNETTKTIQEIALKVHSFMGCNVYSRVDFRLEDNYSIPMILEINTLPGMTETSLFPMAAKANGLSFEDLIDKIIKLSLEK
tara:strand:+ start:474 stop:1100 length:627 start_codon:yes stop_codon:yes gene_type:complete